jgi:uncharacterized membrane protein
VGRILLAGVLVSAGIVAVGLALLIPPGTGKRVLLAQLLSEHVVYVEDLPHSLRAVATGVAHGRPVAVIFLGVLLLIFTPVLRVLGAGAYFAATGERRYALISLVVLVLLLLGFVLGAVG